MELARVPLQSTDVGILANPTTKMLHSVTVAGNDGLEVHRTLTVRYSIATMSPRRAGDLGFSDVGLSGL